MTARYKDLTGQVFGDLTAVRYTRSEKGCAFWEWRCVCGSLTEMQAHPIVRGHTLSCGCRRSRKAKEFADKNSWSVDRTSVCARCEKTKSHAEFSKIYRKLVAFPRSWCKECYNEAFEKYHRNTPEKKLAWALRTVEYKANKNGIPFDIALEDFLPIPTVCPVLGTPMNYEGGRDSVPTFDRVIPSLGYIKENVRIISHRANRIKNDATAEELIKLAKWLETETQKVQCPITSSLPTSPVTEQLSSTKPENSGAASMYL